MGEESVAALREVGLLLACSYRTRGTHGFERCFSKIAPIKAALNMAPKYVKRAPCQTHVYEGEEVDLSLLPIQTCCLRMLPP